MSRAEHNRSYQINIFVLGHQTPRSVQWVPLDGFSWSVELVIEEESATSSIRFSRTDSPLSLFFIFVIIGARAKIMFGLDSAV